MNTSDEKRPRWKPNSNRPERWPCLREGAPEGARCSHPTCAYPDTRINAKEGNVELNPETRQPVEPFLVTIEIKAESLGLAATKIEDALTLAGVDADVVQVQSFELEDASDE